MKTKLFLGSAIVAAALTLSACAGADVESTSPASVPARPDYVGASVTVSAQDFERQANATRTVEVGTGQLIMVSLDSNPSTGFSWTETASIGNAAVLEQTGHAYVAPQANNAQPPVLGASRTETWTFKALKAGQTTVTMQYGRPWEGGEKAARTFILTVVVK